MFLGYLRPGGMYVEKEDARGVLFDARRPSAESVGSEIDVTGQAMSDRDIRRAVESVFTDGHMLSDSEIAPIYEAMQDGRLQQNIRRRLQAYIHSREQH